MLFLDSPTIIEYSNDTQSVVEYVDDKGQLFTSAICVYKITEGEMWATNKSAHAVRQGFRGVNSIQLNEEIAMEAARMQNELRANGEEMSVRDLLIAATARSTGAELVVADSDFQTDVLADYLTVTNLRE
ncbi:MAG: putative nucleic acid-binding protein, contains PIN domain protein [halophilic archaeon J07HX64]|jgi:Predicted nucleic acid-binding protein, contains PIN domain|nr:MAG: putative nucleic acid-binding protein, contains PIN domain protein [halophilic archaeon J07HX64]